MTEQDGPRRSWSSRWLNPGRSEVSAILVLTLTAVGLIGSLLLVWSTISSERAGREQAERTSEVMTALRDIDRAAINAETGQRGYFITLDRRYLANYEFGRTLYPAAIDRLRQKLAGDASMPRQAELLSLIEETADAKFAELETTVNAIERGEIREAQQRILSNDGRIAMERLRGALSEMESVEQGVLIRATAKASDAENRVLPLLTVTLLFTLGVLALGLRQAVRASQADKLAEARDRADLLAHELNHRVKNLFAVVLAIVRMSARGKPEAKEVTEGIAARIHALLDAHEATQGQGGDGNAQIRVLVEKVLAPYASDDNPVEISGPDVALTATEATPMGLVFHELATNAVKYGAWSQENGVISIAWNFVGSGKERQLAIRWSEKCPDPKPPGEREGFGSLLMQSSARQLRGTIERKFEADGLSVDIVFQHPE